MKKSNNKIFANIKYPKRNFGKLIKLLLLIIITPIPLFFIFNRTTAQMKSLEETPWPDLSNPIPLVLKTENYFWDESYDITLDGNGDLYQEIIIKISYEEIPAGYYPVLAIQTISEYFHEPDKSVLVEELPIIKQNCHPNIIGQLDPSEDSEFKWEVCDFFFALGVTEGSDREFFQKIYLMRKNVISDELFSEGVIQLILYSDDEYLPSQIISRSNTIYVEYLTPSEGNESTSLITNGSGAKEKKKFPFWVPLISLLGAIVFIFRDYLKQFWSKGKTSKKQPDIKERVKMKKMEGLKPPILRFIAPKPDSIHPPNYFDIIVEGKGGSHSLIWKTLKLGSFLSKPEGKSLYRVDWKDGDALKTGANTISATVRDNVGQSAAAQVSFFVDAEGPDLSLKLEKQNEIDDFEKTYQSTTLENDVLRKEPQKPPVFGQKACLLKIMVRENPEEHFIGIKTSSIQLKADFACCGLPAGKNLWNTKFVKKNGTEQKMEGVLVFPDKYPLPGGKHIFHLSAEDHFGNQSQIDLLFQIDNQPPLMEMKLTWYDLEQSVCLTKNGFKHLPDIPPTFPCRDIKLEIRVWEPENEKCHSGIVKDSVKLYIQSNDSKKSWYSKPREESLSLRSFDHALKSNEDLNFSRIKDTANLRLTLSAGDKAGNRSELHLDLQVDPSMQEGLTIVDENQRVVNKIYYGVTNRMGPFFLRFHIPEISHNVERILPGTETGGEYDPKLGRSRIRSEKLKKFVFDTKYTFAIGNEDNWLEKKAFSIPSDIRTMLPAFGKHKSDGETLWSKPFFVVISDERDIKPDKTGEDAYKSTYFNIFANKGDFLVVPSHIKKGIIDFSIKGGKGEQLDTKYLKSHRAQIVGGSAELVSIRGTLWDKSAGNVQNTIVAGVRVEAQQRVGYDRASIILQKEDGWKKEIKAKCKIDGKGNLPGKQQEIRFSWPVDSLSPINLDPSKKLYAQVKLFNNEHKILNVSTKPRHVEFPNCSFLNIQPEEKFNPLLDRNHDGKADSLIRVSPKKEIPSDYKFQLDFIDQSGKGLDDPFETETGKAVYDVLLKQMNPDANHIKEKQPFSLPKQGKIIVQQIIQWQSETYKDEETYAVFKKPFLISIGSQTEVSVEPTFELQLTQIQLDRKISIDRIGKDWEDEREYYVWNVKPHSNKNAIGCSLDEKRSQVYLPSEMRLPDPESHNNTEIALIITRPNAEIAFQMEAFGCEMVDGKKKKYQLGGGIKLGTLTIAPAGLVKDGKFSLKHSTTYPEKGKSSEKEIAGIVNKISKKINISKDTGLQYQRTKDGSIYITSFEAELITRKVRTYHREGNYLSFNSDSPSSFVEFIVGIEDDRPGVQWEIKIKLDDHQDNERSLAFIEMPYLTIEKIIAPGFIEKGETVLCRIGLGPKEQPDILKHLRAIQKEDPQLAKRITDHLQWFAHSSTEKKSSKPWEINDVLLDKAGTGNPAMFKLEDKHIHETEKINLEDYWGDSVKKMIRDEPTAYLTLSSANIKSIYFNIRKQKISFCDTKKWEIKIQMKGVGLALWLDVGGAYLEWEAACVKNQNGKRDWFRGHGYLLNIGLANPGIDIKLDDLSGYIIKPYSKHFPTGFYSGLMGKANISTFSASALVARQSLDNRPLLALISEQVFSPSSFKNYIAKASLESVVEKLIDSSEDSIRKAKKVFAQKSNKLSVKDLVGYGIAGVYIILNIDESKKRD